MKKVLGWILVLTPFTLVIGATLHAFICRVGVIQTLIGTVIALGLMSCIGFGMYLLDNFDEDDRV